MTSRSSSRSIPISVLSCQASKATKSKYSAACQSKAKSRRRKSSLKMNLKICRQRIINRARMIGKLEKIKGRTLMGKLIRRIKNIKKGERVRMKKGRRVKKERRSQARKSSTMARKMWVSMEKGSMINNSNPTKTKLTLRRNGSSSSKRNNSRKNPSSIKNNKSRKTKGKTFLMTSSTISDRSSFRTKRRLQQAKKRLPFRSRYKNMNQR